MNSRGNQGRRLVWWLGAVLLTGAAPGGLAQTAMQAERDERGYESMILEEMATLRTPMQAEQDEREGAEAVEAGPMRQVGEVLGILSPTELPANQRAWQAVTVFGDTRIEGEVTRQCVTVFGNTHVTGRIGGDAVTVFGDLELDGVVQGEVVVVMGNARFGSNAVVNGECIVVGGRITAEPGATFRRQKQQFAEVLPSVGDWFKYGLLWGRLLVPSVGWVWVIVALHFAVYFLVALLLPRPVEVCERVLQEQGLAAFGVGLLGLFLFWPMVGVLAVTVAGLVVIPFLLVAAVGAVILGKTATFQWLGRTLLQRCGVEGQGWALTGFLVGFLLVPVVYVVPVLGLVAWGVLLPLGFGTALMALVQVIRESRPARPNPAGAPPATMLTAAPALTAAGTADGGGSGLALAGDLPAAAPVLGTLSPGELAAMPRAGFWIRLAATLLDLVLLAWFAQLVHGYFPLLWLAYHVGMWRWKGTTIGGIVCSLKVVREDGRPVDFTVALVRALAAVFSLVALGLGFFWAGWSPERQSWHDKIAGTVIVKVPKGVSLI